MKKRYLLLFCLSFLCSHKIWADVGAIQIRLNENMQVVDLSTSAVSTPTIDEVFVQQGGLTTAEENQCTFNQDGTVQETECTCPGEGVLTPHGNKYVCCENKKIYKGGAYSSYFMPTCGCPDGYSIPWSSVSTEKLCCKNGQSCYTELGGTEICDNSDACGCPDGSKGYEGYCCDDEGKVLTTTDTGVQNYTLCGCAIADETLRNTNCQDDEKCAKTQGMKWCDDSEVCIADGEECPCVPGDADNACSDEDSCEDTGGCWIDEICKEKDSGKTCAQQACEAGGQKWCGEEGCLDECPCTPGADENACPDDDSCTAYGGCWDGTTCKAVQSCPDDKPWDNNTCACSEPVSCSEGELIDGVCFPCPEEGVITGNGGEEVCCNGDKHWYTGNKSENNGWSLKPNYAKCGCPEGQYLDGNQCFPCTLDTHCSAEGKVCDNIGSHTCVECTENGHCTGGRVCNADTNTCTCPEGEHWNGSSCVECDGNYGTAATWPCTTSKPLCSNGVCIACTTADTTKPYWHNGRCVECTENDPCPNGVCQTETNKCVQCLTNGDCSTNTNNKHCVNNQCVQCTDDEHCEKGLCVDNQCKACKTGADCQDGEWCDLENGLCVAQCNTTMVQGPNNTCYCYKGADSKTPIWDAWRNRCVSCFRKNDKTPVWNGTTCEQCGRVEPVVPGKERWKVWDIYNEKCVPCYDSISANWTDLGCGNAKYHSTYDPREGNTFLTRVCKVEANTDANRCVQCTAHSHCPGATPKCNDQNTCVECNGGYGSNATWACPTEEKPKCNSSGVCEACPTNAPNWDTNRQTCWACAKHYTEPGDGAHCPEDKPYCDRDKDKDYKCETCVERDARIPEGQGPDEIQGKVKTLFGAPTDDSNFRGCFLCKNDKDGTAKDKGCTDNYPICPAAKGALYNACCSINQPKWDNKNKKCVCNAGYTYSETQSKCIPCAVGTYKDKAGNDACTDCPDNKTTDREGSTSSEQCAECTENKSCGSGKYCHNKKCVDCTTDSHCGGGQYCLNHECKNCAKGTRCGCAEYQCATGAGGCYTTRLAWCKAWNPNYHYEPSVDSACTGFACCNHNTEEHKYNGANPACKTNTSIAGQNRTS